MTYVVDRTHYGTGVVLGTYAEDIDVLAGVGVCSTDSVAVAMFMDGADLNVDGEVLGFSTGAWIVGHNARVTIGTTGTIGANGLDGYAKGLEVQGGGLVIENDGLLVGFDTAVKLMGGNGTTSTFLNRGAVTGNSKGLFRDLGDSESVVDELVVTNWGSIQGTAVAVGVHGDLDAQEVVKNRGSINGDVSLGLGSDQYDGRGGTVVGQVRLGGGNDLARPGISTESIAGGAGLDELDFRGGPAVVVSLADSSRNKGAALGDVYSGFEIITATALADVLTGNSTNNTLLGLGGNDTLSGNSGNDVLTGGSGRDTLRGGSGSDDFVFLATSDSAPSPSARDVIKGFTRGYDDVVVSSIDAKAGLKGDQAFVLDTNGSFSQGEIRQSVYSSGLLVEFNIDSDVAAEMAILIQGLTAKLASTDLVL